MPPFSHRWLFWDFTLNYIAYEPMHIDEIQRQAHLPIAQVSSTLSMMELKGLVKQVGNMHYVRTREAAANYVT